MYFTEDDEPQPWRCIRCRHEGNLDQRCSNCGVHRNRVVRKRPVRSKPGGKRGRNSGKVSQHGKKG